MIDFNKQITKDEVVKFTIGFTLLIPIVIIIDVLYLVALLQF